MLEIFIDFVATFVMEAIIGLPVLPKDSTEWKRQRKRFVLWFTVAVTIVGTALALTILNTYGLI
jgi:hypothetical protein